MIVDIGSIQHESSTTPEIVTVVTWAETRRPPNKITLINNTGKYRVMFPPSLEGHSVV